MSTTTPTSKGQSVLSKDLQAYRLLQSQDRLDGIIRDDGKVESRLVVIDVRDLKGMLKTPGLEPVLVATMKQVIRQRAQRGGS